MKNKDSGLFGIALVLIKIATKQNFKHYTKKSVQSIRANALKIQNSLSNQLRPHPKPFSKGEGLYIP
jgi:hypothetical protein